jgi:putative transposase
MPIPEKYLADFVEEGIYHVYNRTNNREKLFFSDENRYFFLRRFKRFLSPFLDTYCWCLLPNHFHFLVKIKAISNILSYLNHRVPKDLNLTETKFLETKIDLSCLIENSFKNFFQSYSLSFNKMYGRKGNLFYKPFKRVQVINDSHFTQGVLYIHGNPVKHRIVNDFTAYPWSSWHSLISDQPTSLLRNEVLDWFGGKEMFISTHKTMIPFHYESEMMIED